ncbi:retrotransposon protein, putative, ty1-copia subclass [Tanacetum coccineum]
MVRSMMSQTTLLKSFWDYALESVARIFNMVPTKKVDKTPYEVWHGQAPKFSYLKVWGCEALVKRDTLTKPDKQEPDLLSNAEFFENNLIDLEASGSLEDLKIIQEEDTNPSLDTSLDHEEDDQEIDEPQSDINPIYLPTNGKTVGRKWLYKKKTDMDGAVHTFKARLVTKGFTQTYGVDYEETFSPVAEIRARRILIAIAAYYDYEIW